MKKLFLLITLFLGHLKITYSMESFINKKPGKDEIIKQIQKVIYFPNYSFKNINEFIQQINEKKLDLANSKLTVEQLSHLLELVKALEPKIKMLDLSKCGLKELPSTLKDMKNLKSINISYNNLDVSDLEKLPPSLEYLIMSETRDSKINLPTHLKKLKTTVIIPIPKIIEL